MHKDISRALHLFHLNRTKRTHCERLAAHDILLQEKDRRGDDNHNRCHCRRKIRLIADLVDELRVDHDRHDVEPLANQHRRSKIRHRVHKHHECARKDRWCDKRHDDCHYLADSAAAEALRRLNQRRVDILHRARRIEVDERIELERQDEQDACKTIDGRELILKCLLQPLGENAASSADEDPRICTDKGRRKQRNDDADLKRALKAHAVQRHEVSKRRADHDGEHRYARCNAEAVDHRLVIVFSLKEMRKMLEGERPCHGILKCRNKKRKEWIDQEESEYHDGEYGNARPKIPA